jgi:hypothetical protein
MPLVAIGSIAGFRHTPAPREFLARHRDRVHMGAIIAALILMFHPAANAYIRATRRTRAK